MLACDFRQIAGRSDQLPAGEPHPFRGRPNAGEPESLLIDDLAGNGGRQMPAGLLDLGQPFEMFVARAHRSSGVTPDFHAAYIADVFRQTENARANADT